MSQALWWVLLFVAVIALLPWALRRWQTQAGLGQGARGASSKVLSAVAVGPQQRVVTLEVGPDEARTCLVLGVTAQSIQCLHVFPHIPGQSVTPEVAPRSATGFQKEMAALTPEREGSA